MEEIKSIPCIKCGREIGPDAVFCDICLQDMEKHPVAHGTMVVIHPKPTTSIRKTPTKKVRKPEDQVRSLKKWIAFLWILIMLLIAGLGIVTYLWQSGVKKAEAPIKPGQNYQTSKDFSTGQ